MKKGGDNNCCLIGIAGGSGSGKSWVARELAIQLSESECTVIGLDSYYRDFSHLPREKRDGLNFDHPDAVDIELLVSHILLLKKGEPVPVPTYDYRTHSRSEHPTPIVPARYVIIEGLFTFFFYELAEHFHYKIYIDTADDLRIIRRILRDINERGRTAEGVIEQYMKTVRAAHRDLIEPSKSKANIVLKWDDFDPGAIKGISRRIMELREKERT